MSWTPTPSWRTTLPEGGQWQGLAGPASWEPRAPGGASRQGWRDRRWPDRRPRVGRHAACSSARASGAATRVAAPGTRCATLCHSSGPGRRPHRAEQEQAERAGLCGNRPVFEGPGGGPDLCSSPSNAAQRLAYGLPGGNCSGAFSVAFPLIAALAPQVREPTSTSVPIMDAGPWDRSPGPSQAPAGPLRDGLQPRLRRAPGPLRKGATGGLPGLAAAPSPCPLGSEGDLCRRSFSRGTSSRSRPNGGRENGHAFGDGGPRLGADTDSDSGFAFFPHPSQDTTCLV